MPMAQHSTFTIHRSPHPHSDEERAAILANPGFGSHFTDHMVVIDYEEGKGWHNHRVVPYAPFSVEPASMVLHYGQAIFEGLKAYRHADGEIVTFRPTANAARFQSSADRMAMPRLSEEDFIDSIRNLSLSTRNGFRSRVARNASTCVPSCLLQRMDWEFILRRSSPMFLLRLQLAHISPREA